MFGRLIKRLLHRHVCEEFTQWETHTGHYSRPAEDLDGMLLVLDRAKIKYTKRWQERTCTICGKIEQRELKHV